MHRGGSETWLMHILRHIDRDRFQMDFLVHTTQPRAYNEEIHLLGCKIIPCLYPSKPLLYARNFKRILREYGPYDIVHSHVHYFSGYVLHLAKQAGVPIRIAHSHLDTSLIEAGGGLYKRLYCSLTKWWINRYATLGFGCSRKAATALFGSGWETDPRWQLLYCGIDLTQFQNLVDSVCVRAEFGIPADAFVIGQVGRFFEQKNHTFLVEIAAEVAKREPRMRLLLVGDGPLRPEIEHKIAQLNLTDRVIFAGVRCDVPKLMLGAMDVFLFPSLCEGLPLVLLEAQAAMLPCIFSDVITEEVEVIKPLMQRLSLSQPASAWAKAVLAARGTAKVITHKDTLAIVENSQFNIKHSVKALEEIYICEC
jgi:glycosyltransferase involved in cell wall biosynthesis